MDIAWVKISEYIVKRQKMNMLSVISNVTLFERVQFTCYSFYYRKKMNILYQNFIWCILVRFIPNSNL